MIKTLLQKLPAGVALGMSVVGLVFSPAANAQLIRQEFEGNFSRTTVSPLLENTTPDNSDYSGFVLFSENGTLEDWQISVDGLGLDLDPDSTLGGGLGPDLIPTISFDLSSPSDGDLSVDFAIAVDAPRFTDEIATSGSQAFLQNISHQLSGWVGKARVVLTCGLNVWQADVNALSDFETFRLLDFNYPQQVHQFIDNCFENRHSGERGYREQEEGNTNPPKLSSKRNTPSSLSSPSSPSSLSSFKGERLKAELGKQEKVRVRDLVKNPLRLALLCQSWQLYEGSLPDTKAELYGQFVEQFYWWKSDRFPIKESKRRELNLALGRLAKESIDSSGVRFRLPQDFIVERLASL